MMNTINSPLFLSLVFPALTVLGAVPLLRWAISSEKKDVYASFGLSLACLIGAVCAFGRVGEAFQFGMNAIVYSLAAISVFTLVYCLWNNGVLRFWCCLLTIVLWVWLLGGMVHEWDALIKVSVSASVLLLISLFMVLKPRADFYVSETAVYVLFVYLLLGVTLMTYAFYLGDQIAGYFALSLCVVALGGLFWSIPRFSFSLSENAIVVIGLCLSALAWDMWLQGRLPLASVMCLVLVVFSPSVAQKLVANAPIWMKKGFVVVLMGVSALPILLGLVFFDVLKAL